MTQHAGHTGVIGRCDLVTALANGDKHVLQAVIQQLQLVKRPPEKTDAPQPDPPIRPEIPPPPPTPPVPDSAGYPNQIADIAIWQPLSVMPRAKRPDTNVSTDQKTYFEWKTDDVPAEHSAIAPWAELRSRLKAQLGEIRRSNRLDIAALVSQVARCEVIRTLPRQKRRRWGTNFVVVTDYSIRLSAFQQDAQDIVDQLTRLLPPCALQLAEGGTPDAIWLQDLHNTGASDRPAERLTRPAAGTQILVLGDLGSLERSSWLWRQWLSWGRRLREQGCQLLAVVPCGITRIPQPLQCVFHVQTWQQNQRAVTESSTRQNILHQLLVLAAPARRIEPGLLRNLRLLIPEATDAAAEVDFWNSDSLASNHPIAATLNPAVVKQQLLPQFEALPPALQRRALDCLRAWRLRDREAPELYFEEILSLSKPVQSLVPCQDLADARAAVRSLSVRHHKGEGDVTAFLSRSTARYTASAFQDPHVGPDLRQLRRELHPQDNAVLPGTDPQELPGDAVRSYAVAVADDAIHFANKRPQATLRIQSSNGVFGVAARNAEFDFWKYGCPEFAIRYGTDKIGRWFEFEVERTDGRNVAQRMRWIPAGSFWMGSESDEQRHHVTLTHGFWMADTVCTQDFWTTVMGDNPSEFTNPTHPVENVSYEDAGRFLDHGESTDSPESV